MKTVGIRVVILPRRGSTLKGLTCASVFSSALKLVFWPCRPHRAPLDYITSAGEANGCMGTTLHWRIEQFSCPLAQQCRKLNRE